MKEHSVLVFTQLGLWKPKSKRWKLTFHNTRKGHQKVIDDFIEVKDSECKLMNIGQIVDSTKPASQKINSKAKVILSA